MKSIRYILPMCLMIGVVLAAGIEAGKKVYAKRSQAALLDAPNPDGGKVLTLQWGKEYTAKKVEGRWVELSVDGKTGWVYEGNLSAEKPTETYSDEKSFGSGSTETSASLAARGLNKSAHAYAGRKGHADSAQDVEWLEGQNGQVTKSVVTQYLKDHKQGEYAK